MFYETRKSDISVSNHPNRSGRLSPHPHLHYHLELVYIYEGECGVSLDSSEYNIVTDSVFLSFPNQTHSYIPDKKHSYMLMIVNPDILPEFSALFDRKIPDHPIFEGVSRYPELLAIFEQIKRELATEEDKYTRPKLRGLIGALFAELFRHMVLVERVKGNSQALNSVIGFCSRNFQRELSLEILAEELHMSKYYISHLFGSRFNMKFNDYINSLRVSAACRYLCNTDKSITEISELVGFGTPRTFNRAFLKQLGKSPSEYRIQNMALGAEKEISPMESDAEAAQETDCEC